MSTAAALQAARRASTLGQQSQSIATQRVKIQAVQASARAKARSEAEASAKARAAAKAKAAVAAEATAAAATKAKAAEQARALKNRGHAAGTTDPREIARQTLRNTYGYGADQYSCFNYIIMRESMWKVNATNPSSGAYGIPQALPGSKMATVAADWRTNPATQIIWAIEYMKDRYGSPCDAQGFKAALGWY